MILADDAGRSSRCCCWRTTGPLGFASESSRPRVLRETLGRRTSASAASREQRLDGRPKAFWWSWRSWACWTTSDRADLYTTYICILQ
eukprot:scaffold217688_cov39-Prasinocladus_malaysianus.AAC.1